MALGLALCVNLSKVKFSILDKDAKETLKVLGQRRNVRKINRLGSRKSFTGFPESYWNGTLKDRILQNNDEFIYRIETTLNDGKGENNQIFDYHVQVDGQAPALSDIKVENLEGRKRKLQFDVQDIGSGLNYVYLQSLHFIRKYPSNAPGEPANPDDFKPASAEKVGDNPNLHVWKPKYGNHIKIRFVDPDMMSEQGAGKVRQGYCR